MKKILSILFILTAFAGTAFADTGLDMSGDPATGGYTEEENIMYQLQTTSRVLEDVGGVFDRFSDGYIDANTCLSKIDLIIHEYEKALGSVSKEGKMLNDLMRSFFSQTENYFIWFKQTDKENPEVNARMVNTKREINREMIRLRYLVD